MLVAAPAAALAPTELTGAINTPDVAEAAGVPAKGRGQRKGHADKSSLVPADGTPAEEAVEVQPKKRACRHGPATSHSAVSEEPDAEPAAEEADAGEAEVQPKKQARARSRLSTSSAATAEQAVAEEVEEQPRKRGRRSGPSTSKPAVAEEETVAPDAEVVEVDGGVAIGCIGELDYYSQQVNWDAIRPLKTFAGRYQPKNKDGAGTWVTRRTLFYHLVPEEYQTTRLQLSFWKYLSEKTLAGLSEADAARQFVQEGLAGAASAAD